MVVSSFSTTPEPYTPPSWTQGYLTHVPTSGRLRLAHVPTPVQNVRVGGNNDHPLLQLLNSRTVYIKRDDLTGSAVETGGNKIRKLEFLLADAIVTHCNAVVTIGGAQSNHCRSTAAACRLVGSLEPHLIVRTRQAESDDVGLTGNLLMDRMMGSTMYTCTPGEYGRLGSQTLVERVCQHIQRTGHRPYAIPVGGSNALGTWGYMEAVEELMAQLSHDNSTVVEHVVFACGSGGTAAGIAIGLALFHQHHGTTPPTLHAMGVCDTPDYFYDHIASIADGMGLQVPSSSSSTEAFIRKHLVVHSSKGKGYAVSTKEELEFVAAFSRATGIVLDPVYTGKALFSFLRDVVQPDSNDAYQNILFWHTGGALGLYDKCGELSSGSMLQSPCHRLDVYGKKSRLHGSSIDISEDDVASSSDQKEVPDNA